MNDIPTSTRKYGVINSVRKYKQKKGNKNDCWNIALSLATGWSYDEVRRVITEMDGLYWRGDGTMNVGYDRRFCDSIDGVYTKEIFFTPKYVDTFTVREKIKTLDPSKKYIIWCWRYKEEGKNDKFHHLMYSTNNEVWDDKKTRLDWFVSEIYEVRSFNNE